MGISNFFVLELIRGLFNAKITVFEKIERTLQSPKGFIKIFKFWRRGWRTSNEDVERSHSGFNNNLFQH